MLAQAEAILLEKQQPRQGRMKVARQALPGKVKSEGRVPTGTAERCLPVVRRRELQHNLILTRKNIMPRRTRVTTEDASRPVWLGRTIDSAVPDGTL